MRFFYFLYLSIHKLFLPNVSHEVMLILVSSTTPVFLLYLELRSEIKDRTNQYFRYIPERSC